MTGAPYLPGFGRCGIPQTSAPGCEGVDDHGHQDLLPLGSERWTAVESHICQNRADTRISCTRSQTVPRVRLSLRKAAWSFSKPTSFTGNTGYGAPVIRYRIEITLPDHRLPSGLREIQVR